MPDIWVTPDDGIADAGDDIIWDEQFAGTTCTVKHDDAGNLIDDCEFVYIYDAWNRLAKGPLESQRLLLPETITVTPQQADLLESSAELLKRLGIEVSSFGTDAVAVQGNQATRGNQGQPGTATRGNQGQPGATRGNHLYDKCVALRTRLFA